MSSEYFDPEDERPRGCGRCLGLMLAIGAVVVLPGLLFPAMSGPGPDAGSKSIARNDLAQIVTALRAFQNEYGHYPFDGSGGLFEDEALQARLVNVLRGLDDKENPRRVLFFDVRPVTSKGGWFKPKQWISGISPKTGALLDPWGHPYRIAIDADYDGKVASPYADEEPIHIGVIAWSLGKDGQQGARLKDDFADDDIVSWR